MQQTTNTPCKAAAALGSCLLLIIVGITVRNCAPHIYTQPASVISYSTGSGPITRRRAEDILNVDPPVKELMQKLVDDKVAADSSQLVGMIRDHFIDHPRPFLTKLSLPLFQTEQAKAVDKILNMDGGFFIECGGLDGERSSNSIWFEQKRNWNGILIEMDPSYYLQIRGKSRKCFSINACLSPQAEPAIIPFREHRMGQGKLSLSGSHDSSVHDSFCFPLLSIMLALNRTHIDYFSLDVEGFEMPILKSIPFDKLDITVFTIEYSHQKSKDEMRRFMESKGYKVHSHIDADKPEIYYGAHDFVFIKES